MDELLVYSITSSGDGCVIAFSGEIDITNAPFFAEVLAEPEARCVNIDLANVTLLDSSGLKALVAAQRHIRLRNGAMRIVAASPIVRCVLEITGLDDLLLDEPKA